jgi:hypothetical protein
MFDDAIPYISPIEQLFAMARVKAAKTLSR